MQDKQSAEIDRKPSVHMAVSAVETYLHKVCLTCREGDRAAQGKGEAANGIARQSKARLRGAAGGLTGGAGERGAAAGAGAGNPAPQRRGLPQFALYFRMSPTECDTRYWTPLQRSTLSRRLEDTDRGSEEVAVLSAELEMKSMELDEAAQTATVCFKPPAIYDGSEGKQFRQCRC